MERGRFIYRETADKRILYGIILLGLILDGVMLKNIIELNLSITILGVVSLLIFNFCFVFAPCWGLLGLKNRPIFYEHGVGSFERDKLIRWESYQEFESIECFIVRGRVGGSRPSYVIAFFRADGTFVEIHQSSIQSLKKIWKELISSYPNLAKELKVGSSSGFLYEIEEDLEGNVIASDQSHTIKPDKRSMLLFKVLKNV